jgi:hypothetical protein
VLSAIRFVVVCKRLFITTLLYGRQGLSHMQGYTMFIIFYNFISGEILYGMKVLRVGAQKTLKNDNFNLKVISK